jgi:hypothetical protein
MSSNIKATQPSWSTNPSSRGAGVPPGSEAAMRASARWMSGDFGLGTGPTALTKARFPVAVFNRAATPGEKPQRPVYLPEDSVEMELLTDDPAAEAVT